MKNRDIIANYNRLIALQKDEEDYFKQTGNRLFGGRIKLTYAIRKNMPVLLDKLKPYQEALKELRKEFFDDEKAEENFRIRKEAYDKLTKAKKNLSAEPVLEDILLEGKDEKEFYEKLNELLDIDAEDVEVHMINIDVLDGLPLDSMQVEALMFMIAE